ncbi:chromosome segregation protein SMC [Amphibacillus cookii]|uniref:chromosome segregation protein SMC n=1 Tax=Amphibacillus cookii TaxID=767787 RepID=UPI00195EB462|nr:chromosome segregation protein SMC [Amphibacillus cookii]MBM7540546.1 chromosome segregation protein [Amphibacillus cookii]
MFLKKLESVGFKSFAERISVDFVPGVTAVVGPNGSGKSNVTDAIRWVLGEQSAKSLRGSKMEDIIFQGSDTRKPLNVAEVTLVLDNASRKLPIDYQEVNVTRRVYRSGESEFFLNKQPCRLKDIIDLFLDSGLGREAFSIISQGKVEEILSSKAEERRTIFEEAAGVLKYKQRKKKAEYKLAETQENLNRVEDIIHEIETQLEPLKQQASLAKEYLEKQEQLTETEVALIRTEIEMLHNDWQHYLKQIETFKEQESQFSVEIQSEAARVEHDQHQIEQVDQAIEAYQQQLLTLTESIEKLTGEKNVMLEREKHTTENKEKLENQLKERLEELAQLKTDLNDEQQKLNKAKVNKASTVKELEHLKADFNLDIHDLEEKIESYKADYIDLLNEQATTKHAIQTMSQQLNQIDQRQQSYDEQRSGQKQAYQQLVIEKEQLSEQSQHMNQKLTVLEKEFAEKQKFIAKEQSLLDDMHNKLEQGNRHIDKLMSRKEMLEEMKEDFQGFYGGVKSILKAREQGEINGIEGAVIELIDIPKAYLSALETALGAQAQHVVVANEKAGRQAISYLKQFNKGRATFLPLDTMKAKQMATSTLQRLTSHPGFIKMANTAVNTKSRYQVIIDHLLGHTIMAKTLKDANELARLVERRYRVVTLEGDIVNPGGSMTGGAKKSTNQSLFARDQEIEELTVKLKDYQTRTSQFKDEVVNKEEQLEQQRSQLLELEKSRESYQDQIREHKGQLQSCQIKLAHYQEQLKRYEQDQAQEDAERTRLVEEKTAKEQKLMQLQNEITHLQKDTEALEERKQNFEQNRASVQSKVQALEVKLAEENKEVGYQAERVKQFADKRTALETSKNQLETELKTINELEQGIDQIGTINLKLEKEEAEKQTVTSSIQDCRKNRLSLTEALSERENKHRTLQNKRQAIVEQRQSIEVKANRLDVELESRLKHLQEDYQMSFEKAKELYAQVEDIKQSRQDVKLLKRSIEELGTINLGSIDEYQRIDERYQFLTEQQTDLIEAKQTLYAVISEMDEEMERRFEQTFAQIKDEFAVVFKQLFGGGHAALTLTDPQNLLTTGVDIKAQPPGKKAQQLALLSGGERALTAIALLFAILRVRPVPFCVLDEVEAALDEANVERFSRYLKMYSQDTQFIVITHRKGTMEGADVLYGVTMQESGVSRFVSVKLEETNALLESN